MPMTSFAYTYDANYNRTSAQLSAYWGGDKINYSYDALNRITEESREDSQQNERWSRSYSYDWAGNRSVMDLDSVDLNDAFNETYSYTANTHRLSARAATLGQSTTNYAYNYDERGNLTEVISGGNTIRDIEYFPGNFPSKIITPDGEIRIKTDALGRRVLVEDVSSGINIRYFYDGLKPLCEKRIVTGVTGLIGAENYEDGEDVSEWYIYDNDPTGSTISSFEDSERGDVVKLDPVFGMGNAFIIGDDWNSINPNDASWNDQHTVLSFWKKGTSPFILKIPVNTNVDTHYVIYYPGAGTDYQDLNGDVVIYQNGLYDGSGWKFFQRNVKEDFEGLSSENFVSVMGYMLRSDDEFFIDDMTLSGAITDKVYNLAPNMPGGIIMVCEDAATNPAKTWYHYDGIGNVANVSDQGGLMSSGYDQEAFGLIYGIFDNAGYYHHGSRNGIPILNNDQRGRHQTTKEYDSRTHMYYFNYRYYDPVIGRFIQQEPLGLDGPNQYHFNFNNPVNFFDRNGLFADDWTQQFVNDSRDEELGIDHTPNLPAPEPLRRTPHINQARYNAILRILEAEREHGTYYAASLASNTACPGGSNALHFTGGLLEPYMTDDANGLNFNVITRYGELDVDWFTALNIGSLPYTTTPGMVYGVGKTIWMIAGLTSKHWRGFPGLDTGERNAILQRTLNRKYSDIFDEEWLDVNDPSK